MMGNPFPTTINENTEAELVKTVQKIIERLVPPPRTPEIEIIEVATDHGGRKTSITLKVPADLTHLFPDLKTGAES
jgi:chorismate mutase